jgi:hypothetical protein
VTEIPIPAVRPVKKVEIQKPFIAIGVTARGEPVAQNADSATEASHCVQARGAEIVHEIDLRTLPGAQPKARPVEAAFAFSVWGNNPNGEWRWYDDGRTLEMAEGMATSCQGQGWANIRILHFVFEDEAAE